MDYVIGCDVGTQSAKAVLLSLEGELAGEASASYTVDYPQPLWAEQPVERWNDALAQAIRLLLHKTNVRPASIRALGLATQVDGVVALGRTAGAPGRALRPAIIWMDRRAAAQCAEIRQLMDGQEIFRRTGLNLDPSHVAPKIRWLAEYEPAVYEQTAYFLLPGSYLAWHLTGELAVDYANASSTLLLDIYNRTWSSEMCRLFAVEPARLAPLGPATARLGRLSPAIAESMGLDSSTIVVIGSGDEHAACLGAGVTGPGLVCDVVGTAEPVCAASSEPLIDETQLVETHCHADPDCWLLENPGFVSGGNYRWFRDHFAQDIAESSGRTGSRAYTVLDSEAAATPPGAAGLTFLPCLMGAMAPTWNETARGVFSGFTLAHTRGHFARAILEGSAYAVRDITDRMQASGLHLHELRVVGGGARSHLWNQIKADVTGLPVTTPQMTETTALGAALLALVGYGAVDTLAEAGQRVVRIHQRFEPQPAAQAAYHEAYMRYRETYFTLLPVFERTASP